MTSKVLLHKWENTCNFLGAIIFVMLWKRSNGSCTASPSPEKLFLNLAHHCVGLPILFLLNPNLSGFFSGISTKCSLATASPIAGQKTNFLRELGLE